MPGTHVTGKDLRIAATPFVFLLPRLADCAALAMDARKEVRGCDPRSLITVLLAWARSNARNVVAVPTSAGAVRRSGTPTIPNAEKSNVGTNSSAITARSRTLDLE